VGRRDLRVPLIKALLPLAGALAALLAGCSPEAAPSGRDEAKEPHAAPRSERKAVPAAESAPAAEPAATAPPEASAPGAGVRRCGWLSNPTPGNWWLDDRDGQWILATQGGESAPGMDDMPDMSTAGWVETNGHYGYGCACMTIADDPATKRVTQVSGAAPRPLKQCRADKALKRPD
jgi:hypothetical protein